MSSILVRKEGGDWTPLQPGRVHANNANAVSYPTRAHFSYYLTKPIDPNLIGVSCICWGHVTGYDWQPSGHLAYTFRTSTGFASTVQTIGATREWTGGVGFSEGGTRRTAHMPFMLLATPSAATVTIQIRIDMDGTGNWNNWSLGNLQSNLFIFPVWTS